MTEKQNEPIIIDGVLYESIHKAASKLCINRKRLGLLYKKLMASSLSEVESEFSIKKKLILKKVK